ncbi:MAG: Smr/MutS family protein [Pseudomonadota bacterium]
MKKSPKNPRLSDDDLALWRRVTDRTEKLDLNTLFTPDVTSEGLAAAPLQPPVSPLLLPDRRPKSKNRAHSLTPSLADQISKAPVQMDKKAFGRMKRGKLKPEGRIDLHGMTLDRAHPALTRFILSAHQNGKRLVLVITGKGKRRDDGGPIPVRDGVLRHQVPQWLSMPPLSSAVLQISQAHQSHGGGGAYYVYLRRAR